MTNKFKQKQTLEIGYFSLISEEEIVEIPVGYDEKLPPPMFRIVLEKMGVPFVCSNLDELASVVRSHEFPFSDFCSKYPESVSGMIARLDELGRPIRNSKLYDFIEADFGIALTEAAPRFLESEKMLMWKEMPRPGDEVLRQRCFSCESLRFREFEKN